VPGGQRQGGVFLGRESVLMPRFAADLQMTVHDPAGVLLEVDPRRGLPLTH